MAERVSSLLRRSIRHLEVEVPDSCRLLVAKLGELIVEIDVDDEVFALRGGDRLDVSDGAASAAGAWITTSRVAILDLLDGRVGLGEAVQAGTVCVLGSLDDLERAHDSMLAFVHATVRAPSQPALLSDLRAGAP